MSGEHEAAVLALLTAAPGSPALVVYDGFVPADVPEGAAYAVVYFVTGAPPAEQDPQASNLTGDSLRRDCSVYVHSVGATQSAARKVDGRVRGALLDVTPAVSGRAAWPIRNTENQPAQRDESTGHPVFDIVSVYRLSSMPA